jgi:hypothetical protein
MARKRAKPIELTSVKPDNIYLLRCHDTEWKSVPVRAVCGEPGWLRGPVVIKDSWNAARGRFICGWAIVKAVADDKVYDVPICRDTSVNEAPWMFATSLQGDPTLFVMPDGWVSIVETQLQDELRQLQAAIVTHQKVIDAHNQLKEKLRANAV